MNLRYIRKYVFVFKQIGSYQEDGSLIPLILGTGCESLCPDACEWNTQGPGQWIPDHDMAFECLGMFVIFVMPYNALRLIFSSC